MSQALVFFAAIFVVPALMKYIPDFDPLTAIMGLFAILALLQRLGLAGEPPEGAGGSTGSRGSSGGRRQQAYAEEVKEVTLEELIAEAERCFAQNSWSATQQAARKATDMDPECGRAWELLALAYKWEGLLDEAKETVKKAQELYEIESDVLKKLAKELSRQRDPVELAKECESKGQELIKKRHFDLAAECFAKGLEALDSADDPVAEGNDAATLRMAILRCRAECAQQLQDWGTCRRASAAVLEKEPLCPQALLQRAASNEALENFKPALDDARKLLSLDPKNRAANRIMNNCQQALRSG